MAPHSGPLLRKTTAKRAGIFSPGLPQKMQYPARFAC
jgi:hypothetical protein